MPKTRGRPKKVNSGEIRFGDALDTKEKQLQAVAFIRAGKTSDFWKVIENILDANIEETERKILEDDSLSPEDRERFRMWRYYQIELRNLPETLIKKYSPIDEPQVPELDPYEK